MNKTEIIKNIYKNKYKKNYTNDKRTYKYSNLI